MAVTSTTYAPRSPGESALYQVVRDHVAAFRAEAGRLRDGEGLPRFVEQEFRNFLTCGFLAGGFARFNAWAAVSSNPFLVHRRGGQRLATAPRLRAAPPD